jgi:hypothetical protein
MSSGHQIKALSTSVCSLSSQISDLNTLGPLVLYIYADIA